MINILARLTRKVDAFDDVNRSAEVDDFNEVGVVDEVDENAGVNEVLERN